MAQLVSATVSLVYCFNKHSTAPGDKELLWPNFSHLGETSLVLGPLGNGVSCYAQHRPLNSAQPLWRARSRAETVMKLPPAPAVVFPAPHQHRCKLRRADDNFQGTDRAWIQMGGQEVKRTRELTHSLSGSYLSSPGETGKGKAQLC